MANTKSSNPQTIDVDYNSPRSIMEELLASQGSKPQNFEQGQEVEGEILSKSDNEIIIDFGSKSEGVISAREFPDDKVQSLKIGDKIKAFIVDLENSEGQSVLSLTRSSGKQKTGFSARGINWQKFATAKAQNSIFSGKCSEVNKGGLVIEVEGARGFLPSSQIGFDGLNILKSNSSPSGSEFKVKVSEIDQANNKLIFTQKGLNSSAKDQNQFSPKQKLTGKVAAVFPFGLVISLDAGVGFVSPQDVSWERIENLESKFNVGQELAVVVIGIDEDYGRLNLSVKNAEDDPIANFAEKAKDKGVLKGVVTEVGPSGISIKLEEGVIGFMSGSKVDNSADYQVGQEIQVQIDSIDTSKRRISLSPFITTTKGLIYK